MPFKLLSARGELDDYTIYFNADDFSPWPLNEDGEPVTDGQVIEFEPGTFMAQNGVPCEKMIFAMSRLSSGQWANIQNMTFTTGKRGKQRAEVGTAAERKVLACCKKVQNIEVGGKGKKANEEDRPPIEWVALSQRILSDLPLWVMDDLLDHIDEINNLDDDDRKD